MCIRDRHGAAHDHAEYLVGALAYLKQLGVAHKALDVVLLAVAVAAEHLLALQADLRAARTGKQLGLRGLEGVALALGLHAGGVVGHELHGADLGGHVRELELDALELADGLAEGGALVGGVASSIRNKASC